MRFSSIHYYTLKTVLCLFVLGVSPKVYSQTSYKVTYHIAEPKLQGSTEGADEATMQFLKQMMDYAKTINYILIANQEESYFQLEEGLRKGNDTPLNRILLNSAKRFSSFHEKLYVNYNEDHVVFVKNLINKDFTVKTSPHNFNWNLKEDSKKILGFDAKKAEGTYHDPVKNKDIKVEAWFVPSIPLQSGPDIFMGLPGLIAEVHLRGAVVTMKKIEPNQTLEIKKIDASKAMSQQEYEEIIKSLTKKFENIIND